MQQWQNAEKPVFRSLIDENNPWQPSHGAHHAVDLLLLFGGFDLSFAPAAQHTGKQMREKWIEFINGEDPWPSSETVAFGPHGVFVTLSEASLRSRRRIAHLDYLESTNNSILDQVFGSLAIGRISLLN